ncbi:hypothetical protein [Agathobacter sp.]
MQGIRIMHTVMIVVTIILALIELVMVILYANRKIEKKYLNIALVAMTVSIWIEILLTFYITRS